MNYIQIFCYFIEQKKLPKEKLPQIKKNLIYEIERLILEGGIYFFCGISEGFNILAIHTVLKLKEKFPHIKLVLVLPYKQQELILDKKEKELYNEFKDKADDVIFLVDVFSAYCAKKGTEHILDSCGAIICYIIKDNDFTEILSYAKSKDIKIINIALDL